MTSSAHPSVKLGTTIDGKMNYYRCKSILLILSYYATESLYYYGDGGIQHAQNCHPTDMLAIHIVVNHLGFVHHWYFVPETVMQNKP